MADERPSYAFMKTGFSDPESLDQEARKDMVSLIVTFAEKALQSAGTYVLHAKRRVVTPEDVKRAMMLEIFLFGSRPNLLEKAGEIKKELFTGSSEDEEEEGEGVYLSEDENVGSFAKSECDCALCGCINEIYSRWEGWEPQNKFEEVFKEHIDEI